jgi:amino acid adenylation domain-containing protein/thioester reductase-like protein
VRGAEGCAANLPGILAVRAVPDFEQTRLTFSPEIVAWLEQRAEEEGAPRESIFVAALLALLARYSGRDDVGLAVHSQGSLRWLHIRLDGEPDTWQLLGRTAMALGSAVEKASGHSDRPPGEVCTGQIVPGARGGVQVLVQLDGSIVAVAADLVVVVERYSLQLLFRRGRFEDGSIPRVTEHLRALSVGLATATGPVSGIPIVHGEERTWVLAQSNATHIDREESLPTVVECFERHAQMTPDALAIVDGERALTYRELDAAADAFADNVCARGVAAGVRVATYLERGADAIIAFLGILKARGIYVPVDTSYPPGRVAAILASAAPNLVVTRTASASMVQAFSSTEAPLETFCVDTMEREPSARARPAVRPDDAAYTFFTSGSTGRPKGVVVDHRALANYVRAASEAYGVSARDRVLQAASLGFDLSLEEIIITLTAGAALVVRSAGPIESVQSFFDECIERRLTVLSITSALWHELTLRLADGSVQFPPLIHLVILGADVARPDVLAAWQRATGGRVRLINSYGLTETTIVATVWEAGEQILAGDWRALPIGRPLRNVSAYVLDPRNELVPVGVAGELCIGGLAVARGYLGDDELTQARFVPDPYVRGGWMYRSGDRGILRSSGELEFLGRADYRVKVQGVRIELGEIEARLRECQGVVEAVAIARTKQTGETELEAHVMVSSHEVTPGWLRGQLRSVLPPAAVPTRVHVVDRFPLTPAGKIDRRALAANSPQAERTPFVAPHTALERLVASTTAEVLGLDQVGLSDGFLALGGTSLSAVRAASVLGPRLGRRLAAQLFLECPTLAELCAELERPAEEPRGSARPLHALHADAVLTPGVVLQQPPTGPAPLESVLLTGATGYFGTFVLAELLRETAADVICLVRAPTPDVARARVLGALSRRGCPIDPELFARRVSCVCGDVAQPRFDLSRETFQRISASVDAIFHLAAKVSMLLPYETLRASNVSALEWVLHMAVTGRPKTVHHVSTIEVLADIDRGQPLALAERAAAPSPALLESGYGQSKWVAEKLIEQARERGLRAYIHRPGRLTGHSLTGAFNDDDFLVQLLDACGRVAAAPMLDVEVDMTPVDGASRALVRLARTEPEQERFHLVRPDPIAWTALIETVIAIGYPLRVVPHSRWRSMLHELTARDEHATFLHYLASLSGEEIEASLRGGHATAATSLALGPGFEWPPTEAPLLATYLRALSDAGRFALGMSPKRSSVAPSARRSSDKFLAIG